MSYRKLVIIMKKFVSLCCVLAVALTLFGCGSDSKKANKDAGKENSANASSKFTCEICEKEKTGKKNVEKIVEKDVTMCDDCYKVFETKYTCDMCRSISFGGGTKVEYMGQNLTFCETCYPIFEQNYKQAQEPTEEQPAE